MHKQILRFVKHPGFSVLIAFVVAYIWGTWSSFLILVFQPVFQRIALGIPVGILVVIVITLIRQFIFLLRK